MTVHLTRLVAGALEFPMILLSMTGCETYTSSHYVVSQRTPALRTTLDLSETRGGISWIKHPPQPSYAGSDPRSLHLLPDPANQAYSQTSLALSDLKQVAHSLICFRGIYSFDHENI
jgi:hypothetical protein